MKKFKCSKVCGGPFAWFSFLHALSGQSQSQVQMSYQEWLQLWKRAEAQEIKKEVTPRVPVVLQKAEAVWKLREEESVVLLQVRVRSLSEDWHWLPLCSGGVAWLPQEEQQDQEDRVSERKDVMEAIWVMQDGVLGVLMKGKGQRDMVVEGVCMGWRDWSALTGEQEDALEFHWRAEASLKVEVQELPEEWSLLAREVGEKGKVEGIRNLQNRRWLQDGRSYLRQDSKWSLSLQSRAKIEEKKVVKKASEELLIVESLHVQMEVAESGEVFVRARASFDHRGEVFWDVHLPENEISRQPARLLQSRWWKSQQVVGERCRPGIVELEKKEWLRHVIPSDASGGLEIQYTFAMDAMDSLEGSLSLELPLVRGFVRHLFWQIDLPEKYRCQGVEGTLGQASVKERRELKVTDGSLLLTKHFCRDQEIKTKLHYVRLQAEEN